MRFFWICVGALMLLGGGMLAARGAKATAAARRAAADDAVVAQQPAPAVDDGEWVEATPDPVFETNMGEPDEPGELQPLSPPTDGGQPFQPAPQAADQPLSGAPSAPAGPESGQAPPAETGDQPQAPQNPTDAPAAEVPPVEESPDEVPLPRAEPAEPEASTPEPIAESPAGQPVEQPIEQPVEQPTAQPEDTPADLPAESPVEVPGDRPADAPVTPEIGERQAEPPATDLTPPAPTDTPTEQPATGASGEQPPAAPAGDTAPAPAGDTTGLPKPPAVWEREDGSLLINGKYVVRGEGTEAKPYELPWELLIAAREEYNPRENKSVLPEWTREFQETHVKISGYLLLPLVGETFEELLVMRNQWDGCCIGVPPTAYDAVEVKLAQASKLSRLQVNYGSITGVFKVDPYLSGKWLIGLYIMEECELAEPSGVGVGGQ